jgi:hypothetical protein
MYLVIGRRTDRGRGYPDTQLSFYFAKAPGEQNEVRAVEEVAWERSGDKFIYTVDGVAREGLGQFETSVENHLSSGPGMLYGARGAMPLRNLVYSTLHNELRTVEEHLRRRLLEQ